MANLILNGSTSGSVTLSSPAVSGTTTLTLPTTSGTVVVTSGAQTIEFADGSASTPSITNSGDTNTGMFFPAADTIAFAEGGTETMRLDSSGNVKVANGDLILNNDKSVNFGNGDDAFNRISLNSGSGELELRGYAGFKFYTPQTSDAVSRMSLNNSGNLTIFGSTATKASGTTWANPSDIRLKDNVQDFAKGLTELLQVNVKTWEYNGKGGTTAGTKGIGVIADEIETVLPETVDTYKAKLNIDDTKEADIKRFDATEITWLLVKAIQEQQTIIESLKTDIVALKAKVGE
jgi:hypothetical protein